MLYKYFSYIILQISKSIHVLSEALNFARDTLLPLSEGDDS